MSEYISVGCSLIALGLVLYMFFTRKKIYQSKEEVTMIDIPKQASEAFLKTMHQQEQKIEFLQAQLTNFKRETQGIYLKWANPREDKAAYLLRLYNDSPEKIYNVKFSVNEKYEGFMKLFHEKLDCESEKSINLFFIPGVWQNIPQQGPTADRLTFIEKWIENRMEPIKFTVEYLTEPLGNSSIKLDILFTKENLTINLRSVLQASRNNLTLLS